MGAEVVRDYVLVIFSVSEVDDVVIPDLLAVYFHLELVMLHQFEHPFWYVLVN